MELFGDILIEQGSNIDFDHLRRVLKRPFIKPRFRLSVLNPDETVNYIIPSEDIVENGISYTEEYQNGQRRSISLQLINANGKYTPSINGIWLTTKFRLDVGIVTKNTIVWFPKGIYVMGDVNLVDQDSANIITIQLKDKYAIFEGKLGTLESAYEVEVGSNIKEAVQGVLNFSLGNGYIFDYQPVIFDASFLTAKTQNTIRIEEGGHLGQIIEALATQISAEYYYNSVGNLCFYPINVTVNDDVKPVIWTFEKINKEMNNLSLNYKNEEVVNVIKVVGDNIDNGIHAAVVENNNPKSPICIQQIGRRAAPKFTEANIWNDDLAYDLARYYLRLRSFVSIDFGCTVSFNPILAVNNIVEVENDFIGLRREKLLLISISYSSPDGLMSLKL